MTVENASPQPSSPAQGTQLAPPVISDGDGMSESEAMARIKEKIAGVPPVKRAADGRFVPAQEREPAPAVTEPEDEAPIADEGDEAAPGEDDIEIEDGTDAESQAPSVDMPESWGKTAEAIWSSLPPEAQQFLRQHETKRTQGITRQLNELKAEQEKVTAAQAAIKNQELQVAQAAQRYATHAERDFLAKFSDLKSQEDVVKLAADNPARYLQYDAALKAAMAARQEAQMFEHQAREEQTKALTDFRMAENQKLVEALDIKDEAAATAFEKSVMEFTGKLGIPTERVSQYRADELLMVRDAMRYRAAVAKKQAAQKAANPPPRVVRPGAQPSSGSLSRQTQIAQLSRNLQKTGSEKDAQALIKAKLFGGRR